MRTGFLLLALLPGARAALAADTVWDALRAGGAVVLLRHAQTTPGVGDPPGFRLEDCATQRNLSDAGRAQARRLGDAFRARGIVVTQVLSSGWCRCLETAKLAFGQVERWPAVDSFFEAPVGEPAQSAAVRKRVSEHHGSNPLILVTHQVNITALTGLAPAQGEMVVLRPVPGKGFTIVGRAQVP